MKEATFTNKVDIHGEGLQLNELSEERMNNVIRNAVASYDPENKQYSTYLKISDT